MRIWVDADACPNMIKEILFRAATRTSTFITLISNHAISTPPSPFITKMQVTAGYDVADSRIIKELSEGDLVITADIPLADEVVNHGGIALNPRGQLYTPSNIKEKLAIRNMSDQLRSAGKITGGPPTLTKKNLQDFANQLEQWFHRKKQQSK